MRVLVATDGSEDARAAIRWLREFALPADARVLVVSVAALPPSPLDIPFVRRFDRVLLDEAGRAAEEARTALAERWPDAEARTLEGDPRDEIVRVAEQWQADLVVVGARGLGAVSGFLLGSVSHGVAREAPCPVLVVKGAGRGLRRAVVAIDGSNDALAAAAFVAGLPLDRTLRLRLLAVVEPPHFPGTAPGFLHPPLRAALDEMLDEQKAQLDGVLARVEATFAGAVGAVERSVVVGRPAEEIIRAAREPDVGLVVVGARGLGPIKRLLLGSVSERVLRHAACPVLVVKGGQRR